MVYTVGGNSRNGGMSGNCENVWYIQLVDYEGGNGGNSGNGGNVWYIHLVDYVGGNVGNSGNGGNSPLCWKS